MRAARATLDARAHDAGVIAVQDAPREAAELMCAALAREIGTHNDQLAPAVWDHGRGRACGPGDLVARVEELGCSVAIAIVSTAGGPLELRARGLRRLVNPTHSHRDGPGHARLVLFPLSISRLVGLAGADLVYVPAWANEQVFHPTRGPDETYGDAFKRREAWATVPASLLQFCTLLARRRLPLVSTHDLVAHVAGFEASSWPFVQRMAARAERSLRAYLARAPRASVETLILPFVLGVVLDTCAQPSSRHLARPLSVLLETIADYLDTHGARLAATAVPRLDRFPREYAPLMSLASSPDDDASIRRQALPLLEAIARQTTTRALPCRA